MAERRRRPRLALKALARVRVAGPPFGQELECNHAMQPDVFRLVDDTHSTRTQWLGKFIPRGNCAGNRIWRAVLLYCCAFIVEQMPEGFQDGPIQECG